MSGRDELREAMRGARVVDLEAVDVPEWGRKVYIRPLAAKEQLAIAKQQVPAEEKTLRILLVSIVDENGERYLEDDDFDLLLEQPVPSLIPLIQACTRVNGVTEKELEEAVEHFGQAQGRHNSSE